MKFKRAFSFNRRSMPDDICPSFRKIISNRLRFDVFMQFHKRPIEAYRPLFVPDFICIFVTQLGNPRNQSRSSKVIVIWMDTTHKSLRRPYSSCISSSWATGPLVDIGLKIEKKKTAAIVILVKIRSRSTTELQIAKPWYFHLPFKGAIAVGVHGIRAKVGSMSSSTQMEHRVGCWLLLDVIIWEGEMVFQLISWK